MDVTTVINELSTKFNTTAQYLIAEMGKYYVIENVGWALFSIIAMLSFIYSGKRLLTKAIAIKKEDKWGDYELPMIFGYLSLGISFVFICVFFVAITDLLQWCITPTAATINEILKLIGR